MPIVVQSVEKLKSWNGQASHKAPDDMVTVYHKSFFPEEWAVCGSFCGVVSSQTLA
jgi:hypothetical protein